MGPLLQQALLVGAVLLSALPPSRRAADDPDQRFAENTLQVISWANLPQKGGKTEVAVVVGVAGRKADAQSMATRLKNLADASYQPLHLSVEGYQLTDSKVDASRFITRPAAVLVVLQAGPADLRSLQAYAYTQKTLTLSRRPQDIGFVSVVILPTEMYLEPRRCAGENGNVEGLAKQFARSVPTDFHPFARDAREAVRKSGRKPDWAEAVRLLRLALMAQERSREPVRTSSTGVRPYVPHLDLSEALARLGECEAARAEWLDPGDSEERRRIDKAEIQQVEKLVSTCPAGRGPAIAMHGGNPWLTGSF